MSQCNDDSSEDEEEELEEEQDEGRSRPKWVRGSSDFTDFSFHPSAYDLATVDMDGFLSIHELEPGKSSTEVLHKQLSKKPLRCVTFSSRGGHIYVAGKSGGLRSFDSKTGTLSQVLMKNDIPLYCIKVINQNLIAGGDDDGTLKVWDVRKGANPIMEEDRVHDFISNISVDKNHKFLFATSGDGTMSTYNIKRRKFMVQSENAEFDMSCVTVAKNNKKVIVGTSEGLLLLYNWEEFAAPSDRLPGHGAPIECLVPINENVVCTGTMDGTIRAVHILPNRFLGVVGEHNNMPVHKVAVCCDRDFIASSSHDSIIKFWNVDHLHNPSVNANAKPVKGLKQKKLVKSGVAGDGASFLSDLNKDMTVPAVKDSDSDSDDDSDDSEDET